MPEIQTTISPIDQKPVATRVLLSSSELDKAIDASVVAQKAWKKVPLDDRIAIAEKFLIEFEALKDEIVPELTKEMGRPISQTGFEVNSTLDRARHLISIAKETLKDAPAPEKEGFTRFMRKEPLGVVAIVSPWNYPYMCLINSIIPGLLAGNSLLLKPSPQTPSPASRLQSAFLSASLPADLLQVLHLSDANTGKLVADRRVAFVSFTGSVKGGKWIDQAAAGGDNFKGVGLELGGKDPAYVRADADLAYTAEQLVDGAFFNSGQSCCGVERIYVHESVFDEFVARFVEITKQYVLSNPLSESTTLGPVISLASASRIRAQVAAAISAGAKPLIDEAAFPEAAPGTTYVAPQVLTEVHHAMAIMMEESFGPCIGIMKVKSDEEALEKMNDSPYGLTASIWTSPTDVESQEAFRTLSEELETGTVFLNRCDCLDPALAWTGVKNSGRGVSLSPFGFDQLTRLKSIHMKEKL